MIRDVLALPGRLGAAAKRACDRFRRLVRAKAGIALTMTAGSAVVSRSSPMRTLRRPEIT